MAIQTIGTQIEGTPPMLDGMPPVMTPKQLAQIIHTTENTLAQERFKGIGPAYTKCGARVRYLREDVIAYLQANRVATS